MKIIKFGGSCLRNIDDFKKISKILKEAKGDTIIVLSAIYGITDILIDGLNMKKLSENSINKIIKRIRAKHIGILKHSFKKPEERKKIEMKMEPYYERLKKLYLGVLYTEEVSDSVKSSISSFGERLSVLLFTELMNKYGLNTIPYFSDEIGVVKKDNCSNCADLKKTKRNLKKFKSDFSDSVIPVITGYLAIDYNKRISTFGRNGSDYSAAVIAHGLDADILEFWKDVPGFMSSNPTLVKNARIIDELSFDEAAELSYFGASILHPRCLEPIRESKTEIIIRNFINPKEKGTIIKAETDMNKKITGVTFNEHIAVLKINGAGVGYKPGIIGHIGTLLSDNEINIYSIITSQTSINLIIDQKDIAKSIRILKIFKDSVIENIESIKNLTLIAVVGKELSIQKNALQKMFSILTSLNINIEMLSAGASNSAYYFLIKKEEFHRSINKIHDELIE